MAADFFLANSMTERSEAYLKHGLCAKDRSQNVADDGQHISQNVAADGNHSLAKQGFYRVEEI